MKKVLLIRPPRYYWPFINEYDNFMLPQSLPCLAAALRARGITVRPIDCMPLKIGWKTLADIIKTEQPNIIGVGDSESLYANEAAKLVVMAKQINPAVTIIAGGAHFSNLTQESLRELPIDFIVKGEGEETLVELTRELDKKTPYFHKIKGIVFKEGDQIIETVPRPLMDNLDELPLPAYDLMPMNEYGKARFLFSPGGITIHHSRGCVSNCSFCVWWVQMAQRTIKDGKTVLSPRWRTKSVGRTIEEIELLYHAYHKRSLVFVDDSWNVDPAWNDEFAEIMIKKRIKLKWFAFMRADFILRDEKLGIMEKLVKAGLSHVSIGAERASIEDLNNLGKQCYDTDTVKTAMHLLAKKYPQVFRQVTFIVGVRKETKETMLQQLTYAKQLRPDYPAFHSLTPVPGTKLWDEAKRNDWLEVTDFSFFDWSTPVMPSEYLSRYEIDKLLYILNKRYTTPLWLLRGLLSRYPYKRNMYIWWVIVVVKMAWDSIGRLVNPFRFKAYTRLIKPRWYDS